jgi:acetylornithine aminotransferase
MDAADIHRALRRMAHEVIEHNHGHEEIVLVGLQTGGVELAHALATVIEEIERRGLLAKVSANGQLLQSLLQELVARHPDRLAGERGWGLLRGLVLREGGVTAPEIVQAAMAESLLLVPAGPGVVRFVPPLVIKPRHLRKAVKRLEKALHSLA